MKLSRAPLALYFDVLGGPDFEMDSADLVYSSNITLLLLLLVVVVSAADTCVERPMNFKSLCHKSTYYYYWLKVYITLLHS